MQSAVEKEYASIVGQMERLKDEGKVVITKIHKIYAHTADIPHNIYKNK